MKKILYVIFVMIFVVFWAQSCYYDDPPEFQLNLPDNVSFTQHIIPILNKSCSTSTCHDGNKKPDLRADVAFTELAKGGYISTIFPKEGLLYRTIKSNDMPPDGSITALDKALILKWLEDGANNN